MSMMPAFLSQGSTLQAQSQMNGVSVEAESFDEELVQAAPAEGFEAQGLRISFQSVVQA